MTSVESHSAELKKELGLRDLVLQQIVYVVGTIWVGTAAKLGHQAVLLVGDAGYYERFGFSAEKTRSLWLPGRYDADRFLARELSPGALDGTSGLVRATGQKMPAQRKLARAVQPLPQAA